MLDVLLRDAVGTLPPSLANGCTGEQDVGAEVEPRDGKAKRQERFGRFALVEREEPR